MSAKQAAVVHPPPVDPQGIGRWARLALSVKALAALFALGAAGCASPASVAVDAEAERVAFHVSSDPTTQREEREFRTRDGTVLGYTAHVREQPRAALVYLHGIESHGGWFEAAADGLCARGFDVFCLDRRGSGINRENRGFTSGYVDRAETLLADIHYFIEGLPGAYDHVFLVGLSWGGKLATAFGLTHPEAVDGLVLITPGLIAEVDVGWLEKIGIFCCTVFSPRTQFRTPIEPEMFTETPQYLEMIRTDPLRLEWASARFLWESHGLDGYVSKRLPGSELSILLFLAGGDQIIDNDGVLALLLRGDPDRLTLFMYEDQTHSIQFDATERLVVDMTAWLDAALEE